MATGSLTRARLWMHRAIPHHPATPCALICTHMPALISHWAGSSWVQRLPFYLVVCTAHSTEAFSCWQASGVLTAQTRVVQCPGDIKQLGPLSPRFSYQPHKWAASLCLCKLYQCVRRSEPAAASKHSSQLRSLEIPLHKECLRKSHRDNGLHLNIHHWYHQLRLVF